MAHFIYVAGELLLVLALLGLVGVLVWLVMTVLHAKNAVVGNAGRLYKRPLNAGKNLVTTAKGIAQQETVRVKQVTATVKGTTVAVKHSAGQIKTAVQSVHTEDLKPTVSSVQNVFKIVSLATQFTQAASKQEPRG